MSKEQDILKASIKVFSEKGFSAATTSEIAKEAGVAEGTIFRYFKTKKDILRKVMIKLMESISQEIITVRLSRILEENKDKSERELLKILIKDRMEIVIKYWDMIKIVLTEVQFHDDLREAFIKNVVVKGKTLLLDFFNNYVEKAIFKDINPMIAIRSIVGIIGAFILQSQLAPELFTMDNDEQIEIMIDMILYGVRKMEV